MISVALEAISDYTLSLLKEMLSNSCRSKADIYQALQPKLESEPPRDFGRLQLLRRWGDEQDEIFTGSARARGSAGAGASGRV
ncbi:hypothetical protein, partial [Xanthomonas fragariae]|uniref:hypothetical protein n=1 Tax=Xanthomonas fragariae TaxID=48664 RepID=UPI0035309B75